jgi:5'-methylthioadenosine phosphorylase
MIGIIGGTILLERQALTGVQADTVETGHGPAEIERGTLAGVPVALVQRHGRRRDRPPHRVNHGANLTALAALGARQVLALGSTGALRAGLTVPALMVPHDYINFFDTTVFNDRLVHVTPGFDEPLRALLIEEARRTAGERARPAARCRSTTAASTSRCAGRGSTPPPRSPWPVASPTAWA